MLEGRRGVEVWAPSCPVERGAERGWHRALVPCCFAPLVELCWHRALGAPLVELCWHRALVPCRLVAPLVELCGLGAVPVGRSFG